MVRRRGARQSGRTALATGLCLLHAPLVAGLAKLTDKEALVELYTSTGGPSWTLSSEAPYDEMLLPGGSNGWDTTSDPCPVQLLAHVSSEQSSPK